MPTENRPGAIPSMNYLAALGIPTPEVLAFALEQINDAYGHLLHVEETLTLVEFGAVIQAQPAANDPYRLRAVSVLMLLDGTITRTKHDGVRIKIKDLAAHFGKEEKLS